MADNVPITAGSGTNIATDDVSGVHYQRVKLVDGTLDSSAAIPGDATNGLDVDVTRVKPDGTNTMPSLDSAARRGYVQISDGSASADIIAAGADNEANARARLEVCSHPTFYNGTTWDRFRGDITNGLDVDVTRLPALVAGTANIGDVDVASIAAGDNNIGNVDIVTVPAPLSTTGGGTEATAQRVTIASDSTGVLSVDDNGASLTVDGTVTVNATDLDIRNLSQAQDSVAIGDGTDTVAVSTAAADGESNTVNRLEVEAYEMGFNGSTWDRKRWSSPTFKCAQYTTTQTGAALWTPGSGKKIAVTALQIQAGGTTAGTVQVWFGASADTAYTRGTDAAVFDGEFAPSATLKPGVVQSFPYPLIGTADYVLRVTDSAAINPLTVTVWGFEI
jgi:hypothetical protein